MKLKISYRKKKNLLFRKIISKSLAIGLLLNNGLYSFAGTLSEDGRYETFIDNNIIVNDVLEEDKVDVEIEGNTLVNLVEKGNEEKSLLYSNSTMAKYKLKYTLKENTTYTIVADIKNLDDSESSNVRISLNAGVNGTGINTFKNGFNVITCNTYTVNNPTELWVSFNKSDIISINPTIKNVMLFEGDLTSNPPIEYFEGIQSSFENNLVTQDMVDNGEEKQENLGKYKVEVKSTGKNLFNGELENGAIDVDGTNMPSNTLYRSIGYIDVKDVSSVVSNYSLNYVWFNYNKEIIGNVEYGIPANQEVEKPLNARYLRFYRGTLPSDLMVTKGGLSSEYEPYKESINTFYLKEPLRAINDGVKDRIIKRNGQWMVERNLGEKLLNGDDTVGYFFTGYDASYNTTVYYARITFDNLKIDNNIQIINDKFKSVTGDTCSAYEESVYIWGDEINGGIYVQLESNRLSQLNLNGFKEWLLQNPITVVYQLETPIYEPLNISPTLDLYLDTTYISNSSNIPANMKVTVDRTINRATEAIQLAKENPTVSNIAKARMWTNLLKETIKKDEINNEINNITKVEGLQIEKKKVSANVDLYIKPLNSLTMSLSTNSIIFDEFSGTEDMEKLNAVDISISSSLPYRLNSYLMSEIKNKDGSNIIPKEQFNIRLNGESDYKAFNDIGEKLVLKEDCSKGESIYGIDLILKGGRTNKADVYKTTIKFEAEQK